MNPRVYEYNLYKWTIYIIIEKINLYIFIEIFHHFAMTKKIK